MIIIIIIIYFIIIIIIFFVLAVERNFWILEADSFFLLKWNVFNSNNFS